jgi:hypothetical protein
MENNTEYTPLIIPTNTSELENPSISSSSAGEDSESIYVYPEDRLFRNQAFMFLFLLCSLILIMLEFKIGYESGLSIDYKLVSLSFVSLIGCSFWFFLMIKFTRVVIWLTAILIPIGIGSFAIISKRWEFSMLLPIYFFVVNFKSLASIDHVFSFGVELIARNKKLILISVFLTLLNTLFSLVLISVAFSLETKEKYEITILFMILMYFWTSSFLKNLEKVTVASIVGEYYFEGQSSDAWYHFSYVATRSFGQIALCSLILGAVSSIQFIISSMQKYLPKKFLAFKIISFIISVLSRFLNDISAYTLVYVGLTGESFWTSGLNCSRLFRRNLILGLFTTSVSRLISFSGKFLISGVVGVYWLQYHQYEQNGFQWWTDSTMAFAVPFYIMGIFTHVFETTYINN